MSIDRANIRWNGWGRENARTTFHVPETVWTWLAGVLGMPALLATPARTIEDIALPSVRLDAHDRGAIDAIVGSEQVHGDAHDRARHALGRSYYDLLRLRAGAPQFAPDAVVYPRSTSEVLALLAMASGRDLAVVPFGGGTSVVGGVTASAASHRAVIAIDMSRMSTVLFVDMRSLVASAEAGIFGPDLEKQLQSHGVTLGHYPQSFEFSTLGGWIAHRGSGQASGGYGRVKDWLLGLKLATPRGLLEVKPFPASSAGPDLLQLVAGSEGTLGIIAEATFRVRSRPTVSHYGAFLFPSFESGADAIRKAVQENVPATMLRLSDADETEFQRGYAGVGQSELRKHLAHLYLRARGVTAGASLLIAGFEGEPARVAHARRAFLAITKKAGAIGLGQGPGQRWLKGRFEAPYLRDELMGRGVGVDTFETATGWTNVARLHAAASAALREALRASAPKEGSKGITMCHISHAYTDGASLYFTCIFPRALDDEIGQWRMIKTAVTDALIANGGTLSHHHGVGEDHLAWMEEEKGPLGLDLLLAAKAALDPKGVLNPGKLIAARTPFRPFAQHAFENSALPASRPPARKGAGE